MRHHEQNGNGNGGAQTRAADGGDGAAPQTVVPDLLPVYQPAPMPGNCVVVRKEFVWGLGGVVLGVGLGLWLVSFLKNDRR